MAALEEASPLDLLVLDALFVGKSHPTHFGLQDALGLVRALRPRKALLVGMSHEFRHEEHNDMLRRLLAEEGLDVQLARDGMCVPLDL